MSPRAWLVDASIYIFRAYFSLPDRWHTDEGLSLNAVYGYASFLLDFLEEADFPLHAAAAFDESLGTCFRNDIYVDYKASRELPDEALAFQLEACRKATEVLGIPCFGGNLYEADDYIATLGRLCREMEIPVTIVTRDKDLGQLILGPGDDWYDFAGGVRLDADGFADKHGVRPSLFADYLALVGDKIDDIPGVPGVGPKTAAALCSAFGDLAGIERNFDGIQDLALRGAKGLAEKLQKHWPQVQVAAQLTRLESHIPDLHTLPRTSVGEEELAALAAFLEDLGLSGPLVARTRRMAARLAP